MTAGPSGARWAPLLTAALLAAVVLPALWLAGPDTVWTATAWSGHDGMQHFRVAADPWSVRSITDNPIRYARILYPLTAHLVGQALAPLCPSSCRIPHLEGEQPGALQPTAWALWGLAWVLALLSVREASLLLGPRGGALAAVSPVLLLGALHSLAFPVAAWGTFRFLRRWGEGATLPRLALLGALLILVHPALGILPASLTLEPWLHRGVSWRRRLAPLPWLLVAVLPAGVWSLLLGLRPGFALEAGARVYSGAALESLPGQGLWLGLTANLEQLEGELQGGQLLQAGARLARHGLLLASLLAFVLFPLAVRRAPSRSPIPWRAYWLLGLLLVLWAGPQVTTDLDNLGRFLLASPLTYCSFLALVSRPASRRAQWVLLALLGLWFLAVDLNYAHAFLDKVRAGGVGVEEGLSWWF